MNDRMNFSCFILKKCDETDKNHDKNLNLKIKDCATEARSE